MILQKFYKMLFVVTVARGFAASGDWWKWFHTAAPLLTPPRAGTTRVCLCSGALTGQGHPATVERIAAK